MMKNKDSTVGPGQVVSKATYAYDEAMELIGNGWIQYLLLFVSGLSLMAVISEGHIISYYNIIYQGHIIS